MPDLAARRARLGLPDAVGDPQASVPVSSDMCDWIAYLAHPCEMPYRFEPVPASAASAPSSADRPAITLIVGPDTSGNWLQAHATFDQRGRWLAIAVLDPAQRRSTAHQQSRALQLAHVRPECGYSAGEAAHNTALFLESHGGDGLSRGWRTYRSSAEAPESPDARIRRIARARIADHVHRSALEALADTRPEEYAEHHEAQKVMRALASDWYPEPEA